MAVITPHAARGGPSDGGGGGLLSGPSGLAAVLAALTLVALCAAPATLFVFRTPLRVWLHSRYGLRDTIQLKVYFGLVVSYQETK